MENTGKTHGAHRENTANIQGNHRDYDMNTLDMEGPLKFWFRLTAP